MNKNIRSRQYSFMKMNKSLTDNGGTFVSCTVAAQVMHSTGLNKSPEGAPVISFVTPIHNRSRAIERMCGAMPSTDETGTTWADVTAWDQVAERFAHYLEKHPRSVITIVGSIRVQEVMSKAGEPYNRAKIVMTGFDHKADLPAYADGASEEPPDTAA